MTISNSPYEQYTVGNLVASGYSTTQTSVSLNAGSYTIFATGSLALQPLNGGGAINNIRQTFSNFSSVFGYTDRQPFTLLTNDTVEISGGFLSYRPEGIPRYRSGASVSQPIIYDGTNYQFSFSSTSTSNLINGRINYSTDLITWQTKTTGAAYALSPGGPNAFVYNSGVTNKYVWCGKTTSTTGAIWTSTDSITWTSRNLPAGVTVNDPSGVCINSAATNKYVLLARLNSTTNPICYSTDGVTWTNVTFTTSGNPRGTCATNGTASTNQIYVYASSNITNGVFTSTDGAAWTNRPTGQIYSPGQVIWFENKYWSFSSASSLKEYATSTDGVTWTLAVSAFDIAGRTASSEIAPFVNDGKLWLESSGYMIYSTDGTTFTNTSLSTSSSSLKEINGVYSRVNSDGTVSLQQPFAYMIYANDTSRTFS